MVVILGYHMGSYMGILGLYRGHTVVQVIYGSCGGSYAILGSYGGPIGVMAVIRGAYGARF